MIRNKFLAFIIAAVLIIGILPCQVFAEGEFTLTPLETYTSESFPDFIKVRPSIVPESGQRLDYYLNGSLAGSKDNDGVFAYRAVNGENEIHACLVDDASGEVISKSSVLTYNFNKYYMLTDFSSITYDDGINASDYLDGIPAKNGASHVIDSDGSDPRNDGVMQAFFDNGTGAWQLNLPGKDMTGMAKGRYVVLEYDIKFKNFTGTCRFYYFKYNSGNNEKVGIALGDGVLNSTTKPSMSKDKWYNIRSVIDTVDKKEYFYIDDVLLNTRDLDGGKVDMYFYNLPRFAWGWSGAGSTFWLDNVSLKDYAPMYDVKTYTRTAAADKPGLDSFPLNGAAAVLEFSEPMGTVTKNAFHLP